LTLRRRELAYFADMILCKIDKVIGPRYASEGIWIRGFFLGFEAVTSLEDLEKVEQAEVI